MQSVNTFVADVTCIAAFTVLYCIVLYSLSIHQIRTRRGYRTCQGKYKLQLQFRLYGYKYNYNKKYEYKVRNTVISNAGDYKRN